MRIVVASGWAFSACVSVAALSVACGSGGSGGLGGGGGLTTSVPESRTLDGLGADKRQWCEDVARYIQQQEPTDSEVALRNCAIQAESMAYSKPLEERVASCKSAYAECAKQPPTPRTSKSKGDVEDCMATQTAGCSATVGEVDRCLVEAWQGSHAKYEHPEQICDTLATDGGVTRSSEQPMPACESLAGKCPNIFKEEKTVTN